MPTLMGSAILAYPGGQRLPPPPPSPEDPDPPHAELAEELERPLVAEADLLRDVGVGGEGEGGAGFDAHLGEGRRGIELADRLGQRTGVGVPNVTPRGGRRPPRPRAT